MAELPPELLAGILASPDDDAPRLAAADWYEEAGDGERAELIRVQCELARPGKARRLAELRVREQELLQAHGDRFRGAIDATIAAIRDIEFRRGFILGVWAGYNTTYEQFTAVLDSIPLVETLRLPLLGTVPVGWLEVFTTLSNLRTLVILVDRETLTWAELEPLTHLAWLNHLAIDRGMPAQSLITDALRERFRLAQEARQREVLDEPTRLAILRTRIGHSLRSTSTGLDWLHAIYEPTTTLQRVRELPSLRCLHARPTSIDQLEAIAELPMLRTLTIVSDLPETLTHLTRLTNLREICFHTNAAFDAIAWGDWLASLPNLECFRLTGELRDVQEFLRRIRRCRSLRVLHLGRARFRTELLELLDLPELVELQGRPRTPEMLDWVMHFPKLRVVDWMASPTKPISDAYAKRSIEMRPAASGRNPAPLHSKLAESVTLADGTILRVPAGMERLELAHAPHAQGDGIELLGAWQEFGPGDEWPDLRTLGPTRIWLERIAAPIGTQNAREWLTRPMTPFPNVDWSSFRKYATKSTIEPRVLKWSLHHLRGLRAVWMGKHHVIRLCADYSGARLTSWERILEKMVPEVRVPRGM